MPSSPIDYTARDYEAIRQFLIDRIPEHMPEWTSRSPNDFGIVLLELFAYVGDISNFYIDRVFNESFLSTATLRSSVVDIAALLGYSPGSRRASSGEVTVTIDNSLSTPLTVPVGTRLASVDENGAVDKVFEVMGTQSTPGQNLIILPPNTQGVVSVSQGESVRDEVVAISDGHVGQQYPLFMLNVFLDSVEVVVSDGALALPWYRVSSLLDASPHDFSFEVNTANDGSTWISFGDGHNGRVPALGSEILVSYRTGLGEEGNVTAGQISRLLDPIPGVVSVTNPDPLSGGADAESVDSIRSLAPRSLRTLTRAVTISDFANLALQIPSVAKASATGAVPTLVTLYVVPVGGGPVSTALQNEIQTFFEDRMLMGVTLVIEDVTDTPIDVGLTLEVLPGYERAAIKLNVENAVREHFRLSNIDLGGTITLSGIYQDLANLPGVSFFVITKLDEEGGSGIGNVTVPVSSLPVLNELDVTASGGVG